MKTADAAALVNVSEATIRQWKRRGYLPDVFTSQDVWRCAAERMPAKEHARLDALWEQVTRHAA
jgi:predicted site-specific integrase-resolvase